MSRKSYWKIKKKNMQYYNETANTYNAQYREEQARKYKAAVETLSILKDSYILDVGCGTGLFAKEVTGLGGYIICVDCSKNMVRKARHEYGNQQVFLCADADYLPFIERTFDNVFSFTLIQNMPDPEKTIVEICRVAKIGSKIVLSAPKKAFTSLSFMRLLHEKELVIVKFVDEEELKDYVVVCEYYNR